MPATKRGTVRPGQATTGSTPATTDLPVATALKLWVVLARAFDAISVVSKANIERHDLTPAEFGILELLHHKGPLLLGEVQKRVLVSSGGITFLVDRLADRGLVERIACPSDRRARYAALTKRGDKLMREIFPGHAEAIRAATAGLSRGDQRALTELLKTLGKGAARVAAERPGPEGRPGT